MTHSPYNTYDISAARLSVALVVVVGLVVGVGYASAP